MVFNFLNCINYVGRGRLSNFGIDAQNILGFFKVMQASDPAFYHAVQVDEEDRPSSVIWVDTRSRIAYDYFSDVVAVDSTHQANQCMMPFAPFTGVNHHKNQCCLVVHCLQMRQNLLSFGFSQPGLRQCRDSNQG